MHHVILALGRHSLREVGTSRWMPLKEAWHQSLYGSDGFYLRERPSDHFRTSAHVGPLFAEAIAELVRELGVQTVCDVGAGSGELLTNLAAGAPDLTLAGVDLRPRPPALPAAVQWGPRPPEAHTGVVMAHEFLDNIPCDVAEVGSDGRPRTVEVDLDSADQRLGEPVGEAEADWLEAWWPLVEPGSRAEVGLSRETAWSAIRRANPAAWLLAVDFGHLAAARPPGGTLSAYHGGRQTNVRFDGSRDVTAAVAFDALMATVEGELSRQRDCLQRLGVDGARPAPNEARTDPGRYLDRLSRSTAAAELIDADGLGAFYWLLSPPVDPPSPDRGTPPPSHRPATSTRPAR